MAEHAGLVERHRHLGKSEGRCQPSQARTAGVKSIDGPAAMFSSFLRKPEPKCRSLVDGSMTLDPGPGRNDAPGIMLGPDIFRHKLLKGVLLITISC